MNGPTVAIALFPGVEELDWVGPWEVLSLWSGMWPDDGVRVFTVADTLDAVTCARGARVLPDNTWASSPPFDVVVWPGGPGIGTQLGNQAVRARVRQVADGGALMTSVCTGSLVYADAGLLDDRPATTHWASLDELGSLGSGIEVRRDDRFVDDGQVVTASGVSAGIDMALHLIRRLHSEERARQVRRVLQYDPAPPV